MKTCHKCNVVQSLNEFSKNKSKKDGFADTCKTCHRAYNRQHYAGRKQYYVAKAQVAKSKIQDIIRAKKDVPCADCNQRYPWYCMDFDHLRDKEFNVSRGVPLGLPRVLAEIEKCEVVCANCHRKRTYSRKCSRDVEDSIPFSEDGCEGSSPSEND